MERRARQGTSIAVHRDSGPRRGFTLIELLVVIAVLSVLISITIPALGTARESSRRAKCLANLRGIGQGLSVYMNDSKGLLPDVQPLHASSMPFEPGGTGNEPSLLDVLADYIDAALPRKGEDGLYIVSDPYKCPSDLGQDSDSGEPLWRTDGVSYEYYAGYLMMIAEAMGLQWPKYQLAVSDAYEMDRRWPLLIDQGEWHKLRAGSEGRNALIYPDMRADWLTRPSDAEATVFIQDIRRMGGLGGF